MTEKEKTMDELKKEFLMKTKSNIHYDENLEKKILEMSETELKDFFNVERVFLGKWGKNDW